MCYYGSNVRRNEIAENHRHDNLTRFGFGTRRPAWEAMRGGVHVCLPLPLSLSACVRVRALCMQCRGGRQERDLGRSKDRVAPGIKAPPVHKSNFAAFNCSIGSMFRSPGGQTLHDVTRGFRYPRVCFSTCFPLSSLSLPAQLHDVTRGLRYARFPQMLSSSLFLAQLLLPSTIFLSLPGTTARRDPRVSLNLFSLSLGTRITHSI